MAKKRNTAFLVLFIAAVFVVAIFGAVYNGLIMYAGEDVPIGAAVAVVDIRGTIYYDLWKIQEIEDHRDNDDVKAILLFINSPGGGVTASQAIYEAVRSAQAQKPVVAFMASVAASGGYYVACAADTIVAHPGTLTGSIGVIASFLNTQELYQKIGLNMTVITTGKYKDVGSPHRAISSASNLRATTSVSPCNSCSTSALRPSGTCPRLFSADARYPGNRCAANVHSRAASA